MRHEVLALSKQTLGTEDLSCISYSNTGSGLNARAQILWFIIRKGANEPSAVAKTVRNPAATDTLERSHANLEKLASVDPGLFVKPLAQTPGCTLEQYVSGSPMRTGDLRAVFDRYLQFQKRAGSGTVDMETELRLLAASLLTPEESEKFLAACAHYFPTTPLPGYLQHGDLTRDNIILAQDGITIIDCEHAHLTTIPGYDIYNLVSRIKIEDPHVWVDSYARELGFSFSEKHHALFPALHELLEAQKKSGRIRERVIYFETLLSLLP